MNDCFLNMAEDLVNLSASQGVSNIRGFLDRNELGRDNPLRAPGFFYLRNFDNPFVWTENERRAAEENAKIWNEKSAFDHNELERNGQWLAGINPNLIQKRRQEVLLAEKPEINEQICNIISKVRDRARNFFYMCRDIKKVPKVELERIIADVLVNNPYMISVNAAKVPPALSFKRPWGGYKTLEDEIEAKVFIEPLYVGSDVSKWCNSRECELCGRFFFYKNSMARFCSDKCRLAAHTKRRNMEK